MVDAISAALSGLTVQKQRLSTAATNIANVSTGTPSFTGDTPESSAVYKPLTVQISAQEGGGVHGVVVEKADASGVDLVEETVTVLDAKTSFKANLAVLKAQEEMSKDLMDLLP